jgi:anti-sigma-K factor RskA
MSTEIHTLSGAYAVDALSAEEAALFRAHLEECAVCRQEVQELREAASLMGASEASDPPVALKRRVLAEVDRTPQQPPKVTAIGARRRRFAPKLVAAAAAVVLVGGVAVGIGQLGGDDEAPLAAPVSQVFEAPDRRLAEVETDRGTVRVATSPARGEMAVDARDLEPLDDEHVYQIWSVAGAQPSSVGLLDDEVNGASMPMPDPGTEVAITIEPAGGSEQPTTDPLVQVDPASV